MGIKDNVLFVRGEENEEPDSAEDIWDDTLLIKAYERAVNLAKQKLAKKVNGDSENAVNGGTESDNNAGREDKKRRKQNRNNKFTWKEGNACRTVYSVDGIEYEATIIRLLSSKGKCIVRYHGYGNEEEVNISSLKPSKGERVREIQLMESGKGNGIESDHNENKQQPLNIPNNRKYTFPGVIPPPPPMSLMANFPSDEGEAFSSMLMSWYMSGYHTGYYQALMKNKVDWPNTSNGTCYSQNQMNPPKKN